ncbi:MAG TPA: o-succinylbenzoate synthase [Oscillatoriales cyanobacterium M59_W2019_021]|nr:MAG: o-succinylbenzoate synthase [Cyanobacteria bacterium J055]HIK33139.1 o-succinylbenzoate synthase [Oscillatoriales cyanobacterium M4454_W2019_049]HIK52612.1 o-succinylbenzoate synthase [Oscillatoriales cyanobacterium M59_W2019_021]
MTHTYNFEFKPYCRKFRQPLQTYHGIWETREGIIIRLIDEIGKIYLGEIAPIPWFGSETMSQALDFCQALPSQISSETIFSVPDCLPACQFGFESAIDRDRTTKFANLAQSILLPTGEAALGTLHKTISPKTTNCDTFKWKIGVSEFSTEVRVFDRLIRTLPDTAKLRLDANGGLSWETANRWLEMCDRLPQIEFLEQPLGVDRFSEMLALSQQYRTPIALDESVSTLDRIRDCHTRGWRGIFVIKAAIAGSPSQLRAFCKSHAVDSVFSSVFETQIGRKAALNLASELQVKPRAVGFGISDWFADKDEIGIEW